MSSRPRPTLTQMMNPNPNLFQLTQEAQSLMLALIESKGEITPEIEARLTANESAVARKVDAYVYIEEQFDAQIALLKRKEEGFRSIRKGLENAIDRMRGNIKVAMTLLEKDTLAGDEYRYKLSKRKPKVVITDEKLIPMDYKIIVQTTGIDKEKLEAALTDGFAVPGAHLEEVKALLVQENPVKE